MSTLPRRPVWNHYTYTYGEGRSARVEFDVEAAIGLSRPDSTGARLVADAAVDEGRIAEALGELDVLLVGILAYAGQVERVIQTPSPEAVTARRGALAEAGVTLELTPGWAYFEDRVSPSPADWQRIGDREALERLDLDGDGHLRVLHRFFGTPRALDAIATRLTPEGFEDAGRDGERMTLAHVHPIGDISRITVGLLRLCEHHGVAYDGWALPG